MNIVLKNRNSDGVLRKGELKFNDTENTIVELATGITDKDGDMIFSNDVIIFDDNTWRVVYDDTCAQFMLKPLSQRLAWFDEHCLSRLFRKRYKRIDNELINIQ